MFRLGGWVGNRNLGASEATIRHPILEEVRRAVASTVTRRPLPALISLLALLALTALVWWRVLDRGSGSKKHTATPCPTPTARPAAQLPSPRLVTVQVLNSTTRAGIAGKARTALGDAGFVVPQPAANDLKSRNKITSTAQIRYATAQQQGARLLEYYLPGSTLVPTSDRSTTVVVSLGKGYRGVATPSAVQAALRKANLVVGTSAAKTC